jgi:hypothetical protein
VDSEGGNGRKEFFVVRPEADDGNKVMKVVDKPMKDQKEEQFVILFPNAVVQPFAVMVELAYTSVAGSTVLALLIWDMCHANVTHE